MIAQLAQQQDSLDSVFIWAERDGRARLIVDQDMTIRWTNDAAVRMVRETSLFDTAHNRLELKDSRWSAAFKSLVHAAGVKASTLCIPQAASHHILCTAVDLGPTDLGRRMAGLTLRCTAGPIPIDGTAAEIAFQLTSAERRIVESLFSGHTAEEAGAGLRVSIGTVRSHIRHIYQKLDVGSREAMFRKLLPYLSHL